MNLPEILRLFEAEDNKDVRAKELQAYIQNLKSEGLSNKVTELSLTVWEGLNCEYENFEVPDACPGESDNLMLVWNDCDCKHYLECEVSHNKVEFFYRNRQTGEVWGSFE